jgi:Tol biopolymer transport system component
MSLPVKRIDGKSLAMVIKRGDKTHAGIVSAEGGPVEQLTVDDGQSRPASFSPDNANIAFAGERGGVWNIYSVSRATKHVTQLTHFTDGTVAAPAWSPRGNRIVFVREAWTSSLWTLKLPE